MKASFDLPSLGWDEWFESRFEGEDDGSVMPGRVAVENRGAYLIYTEAGELWGELSGRFRYRAADRSELPTVGDWVALKPRPEEKRATITRVLERRTKFSRKEAGLVTQEQVIAANVDFVLVVCALTREFNLRRIERYLTMIWEGGARPVVVLNKSDLLDDPGDAISSVQAVAPGVAVYLTSAVTGSGLDEIEACFEGRKTGTFVGSSGVGKSTLINRLVGAELLEAQPTRSDDRGRHTTVRRELIILPQGGLIIDTPGMRELQLWESEGIDRTFEDIASLSGECRFRDCSHRHEPGCAVRTAMEEGSLDSSRLASFAKLQRELAALERKKDRRLMEAERRKWKAISKAARQRSRP